MMKPMIEKMLSVVPVLYSYLVRERRAPAAHAAPARPSAGGALAAHMPASKY